MRKSLRSLPCAYTPTASRVASRLGTTAPIFVLPDGSSATGSNSSLSRPSILVYSLACGSPRPLEEFARILEQRRIRLVAIEVARQLVLHPRHRRRVAIEELDRCRVLRARPGGDLRILAVLEPPVTVRQRRAMNDVDDGTLRRFRRKERRCTDRLDRGQQSGGHEVSEDFFRHCMSSVDFA